MFRRISLNALVVSLFITFLVGGIFAVVLLLDQRAALKNNAKQANVLPIQLPKATPKPKKAAISAMVVPHHNLVKTEREELFKTVGQTILQPKTVILISPNHYESGKADVQTTSQTWEVTEGAIQPQENVITALETAGAVNEPSSFNNEHGIKLILGDIKRTFPNSTIVPLIFKINTSLDKITPIHDALVKSCNDCLIIASVDFSHYQPAILAELHDSLTLRALQNLDTALLLSRAEVDSPPSLTLMALWAKSHKTPKFVLHKHTNSGILTKDLDAESTTHFFGTYETGEQVKPDASVSFTLGGDMMFGRSVAHVYLKGGLWKALDQLGERVFWGTDAGIVNLEGPVSDVPVPDDIRPNHLVFNFPPETIQALKYLHVNAASLANNHSANQGKKGLDTTRRLLDESKIAAIGGPSDADVPKVASIEGQGVTLKIIGVHMLAGSPDLTPLIKELKQEPKNRVLVIPHWGAEYKYNHGQSQETAAHAWIDAGADVVIGAHPHVIQDSELYKGKPIIYSMGNLLFDQDFSKETQQGLVLSGEFKEDGLHLFALPVQDNKYKPSLMKGATKKQIIDRLYEPFNALKKSEQAGEVLLFLK
jgi:AmmeMemoRadiSam system protein B